ncbi:UDP-Glycosyltransferase/glycogen phosphorylase [Lichtheimia hyalospora FSU 10163]|nr:UDP-Glycosyltransferase/glycogen phosphorylase [Lichtheimia hyalospora FSU 10163]
MTPEVPIHRPFAQPSRRFASDHVPQPIYLGVGIHIIPNQSTSRYSISVHDGCYTTDFFSGTLCNHPSNASRHECIHQAIEMLRTIVQKYSTAQNYKVQLIACSYHLDDDMLDDNERPEHTSMSYFWRELDALPFVVKTHGKTLDECASSAVRKSVVCITDCLSMAVDFGYRIHMVDLADYRKTVCERTWRILNDMVDKFKQRNPRISFFSSTPRGGGVALMRHALLRFLHLHGITVHWYVARPKPEVFDITKRKLHNVLQGIAPMAVTSLTEEEKQAYVDWSAENVDRYWLDEDGPIRNSDIIIVDDPQVTGIIPHIKKHAPDTRIIFRSHIEIRVDLIRQHPNGREAQSWNFLWNFIKDVDLFISHPIDNFVPDHVPPENVVLMPACTDPLDGLNKHLEPWCVEYYQRVFNRVCLDQGAHTVDWNRPYFVQAARFDPSKGIPDCLEAYARLRKRLEIEQYNGKIPQLIICKCGHGSVDDPEGIDIYEETHDQLVLSEYAYDIIVARLPPSDQLLNMVLQEARAALQLSHREGFEAKVTEALYKSVPVIAYDAGGIPLQVTKDVNGFILPVGHVDQVADKMYTLLIDDELHTRMSKASKDTLSEEYFTVWNAMNWLYLFNELLAQDTSGEGLNGQEKTRDHNSGIGDKRKVSIMWKEKYQSLGF